MLEATYGAPAGHAVADWSAHAGNVDEHALRLVRSQRAHRRVALISNATSRLETDLATLGLDNEFDAVFNSSRLGVAKPDPRALLRGVPGTRRSTIGVRVP